MFYPLHEQVKAPKRKLWPRELPSLLKRKKKKDSAVLKLFLMCWRYRTTPWMSWYSLRWFCSPWDTYSNSRAVVKRGGGCKNLSLITWSPKISILNWYWASASTWLPSNSEPSRGFPSKLESNPNFLLWLTQSRMNQPGSRFTRGPDCPLPFVGPRQVVKVEDPIPYTLSIKNYKPS